MRALVTILLLGLVPVALSAPRSRDYYYDDEYYYDADNDEDYYDSSEYGEEQFLGSGSGRSFIQNGPAGCPENTPGTVAANAMHDIEGAGTSRANALSTQGGDVLSNAFGGSLATATSMTNCAGNAQSNAKNWGAEGTRANAFVTGFGSAIGNADSYGQGVLAKSNALATTGVALTTSNTYAGGNAQATSVTTKAGDAISNANLLGDSLANAHALSWAKGGGHAVASAKSRKKAG